MRTAVRVCLGLLATALVTLVATGAWLWFNYLPTAARAWPTVKTGEHPSTWVRDLHRFTAYATVVLALAVLVLLIVRRIRTGGHGVVAGVAVVATAGAATYTGSLLPWDQLALWAVTVGSDFDGVQTTFDSRVKFILVGGREVSPSAYRFWAIAHVVLGVLVGAAVLLAWLRTREPRAELEPEVAALPAVA